MRRNEVITCMGALLTVVLFVVAMSIVLPYRRNDVQADSQGRFMYEDRAFKVIRVKMENGTYHEVAVPD